MKVSVIVPCFNEEENIKPLVRSFYKLRNKTSADLELILVDNGSSDKTGDIIKQIESRLIWVRQVVVPHNQGYGYGILEGLKAADGDCVGWIHADLQSSPAVFFKMIQKAQEEKNRNFLYKGWRTRRPFIDLLFTIGMSIFESVFLGRLLMDINAQPTLMSRDFYNITHENAPHDFSIDLYMYYTAKKKNITVRRFLSPQFVRLHGTSTWNTGMAARWKLIKRVFAYSINLKRSI